MKHEEKWWKWWTKMLQNGFNITFWQKSLINYMLNKQVWIIKHWTLNITPGKFTHLFFSPMPESAITRLSHRKACELNISMHHHMNSISFICALTEFLKCITQFGVQEFVHIPLFLLLLGKKEIVVQRSYSILTELRKDNVKEWSWSIKEWYSCVFWSCWPLLVSVH